MNCPWKSYDTQCVKGHAWSCFKYLSYVPEITTSEWILKTLTYVQLFDRIQFEIIGWKMCFCLNTVAQNTSYCVEANYHRSRKRCGSSTTNSTLGSWSHRTNTINGTRSNRRKCASGSCWCFHLTLNQFIYLFYHVARWRLVKKTFDPGGWLASAKASKNFFDARNIAPNSHRLNRW